MTGPSEAIRLE